jgi:hypothetical protein
METLELAASSIISLVVAVERLMNNSSYNTSDKSKKTRI